MRQAKRIAGMLLCVTFAGALLYLCYGIYTLLNSVTTSFPWWSAFYFTAIIFGPLLLSELAVYLILWILCRRQKGES